MRKTLLIIALIAALTVVTYEIYIADSIIDIIRTIAAG